MSLHIAFTLLWRIFSGLNHWHRQQKPLKSHTLLGTPRPICWSYPGWGNRQTSTSEKISL